MGKHKHFKVKGFWNFLLEAEIHAVPKIWEKWIAIIREKYGKKTQTFRSNGFLNFLGEAEIHTIPKIWKKWIPIVREKYGKTQTFQSNGFLKYFGWSRNPCNSQNMEKVNLHSTGKVTQNRDFPQSSLPRRFRVDGNPRSYQCSWMYKFP